MPARTRRAARWKDGIAASNLWTRAAMPDTSMRRQDRDAYPFDAKQFSLPLQRFEE
jgi:hypothetical protein